MGTRTIELVGRGVVDDATDFHCARPHALCLSRLPSAAVQRRAHCATRTPSPALTGRRRASTRRRLVSCLAQPARMTPPPSKRVSPKGPWSATSRDSRYGAWIRWRGRSCSGQRRRWAWLVYTVAVGVPAAIAAAAWILFRARFALIRGYASWTRRTPLPCVRERRLAVREGL